ncbi:hypothetical protein Tco_0372001, partial [Tanacetum coccineum]
CLLLEPSVDDNMTVGQSLSKHSTLGVDQIDHQFLGADNGSSPLVYSVPGPIDKVPVLQVQHQVSNRFRIPLVELEGDSSSLQETLQESFE